VHEHVRLLALAQVGFAFPNRPFCTNHAAHQPGSCEDHALDDAYSDWALQHNHNLLAQRTVVAAKTKARRNYGNLRPNPVSAGRRAFLPIFQPDKFFQRGLHSTRHRSFDLGLSYLFERRAQATASVFARRRAT